MGEMGLTDKPQGPLARQGKCRAASATKRTSGGPCTCTQQRGDESGQRQSREERLLEISQNKAEGSWRIGEGRPLVDLPDPQDWQLLGTGKLRIEALKMILEIIMAWAEGECLAVQKDFGFLSHQTVCYKGKLLGRNGMPLLKSFLLGQGLHWL